VHYVGVAHSTGEEFDASWNRGQPSPSRWAEAASSRAGTKGVAGMKVGGRRKLVIPPHLGYGNRGAGGAIKPGETLIFVVDPAGSQLTPPGPAGVTTAALPNGSAPALAFPTHVGRLLSGGGLGGDGSTTKISVSPGLMAPPARGCRSPGGRDDELAAPADLHAATPGPSPG